MSGLFFHRCRLSIGQMIAIALIVCGSAAPARGDILVSTFNGSGVRRYHEYSGQLTPTGQIAAGGGGLMNASGVAVGPEGNIYVSSRSTGEVLRYDGVTGAFIDVFATLQLNPNPLPEDPPLPGSPAHLRFGPDGMLYVSDSGSGAGGSSIERFHGTTGTFVDHVVQNLGSVGGFTFAANGDLLVSDFAGPQLGLPSVVRVSQGLQTPLVLAMTSPIQTPSGLLVVDDELWVADLFGNKIIRYQADSGAYLGPQSDIVIPPPIPDELPPGSFASNAPSSLILDRTGNRVLVSVLGLTNDPPVGSVLRYGRDGSFQGEFAGGIAAASDLTLIAPAPRAGDLNGDGSVDAADAGVMFAHWGQAGGADLNGDGTTDAADAGVMFASWSGDAHVGLAVPEPSLVSTLLGGLMVLAYESRRRRWKYVAKFR